MCPEHFSRSIEGLAEARPPRSVTVEPGGVLDLTAAPVRKRIGVADVRMLAYNGSVPGPTLRVREGSEISVHFVNELVLVLKGDMPGMEHHAGMSMDGGAAARPLIEWEDDMPEHNAASTPETMVWRIHDQALGADNAGIHWVFRRGDRVKIRIVNDPESDHPMHHPVHFHGQRFYELEWDGGTAQNIMWKDTVLVPTGKTVDVLLECSNLGAWMVHCHIAEHLEGGMMFTFEVLDETEAPATGRTEGRA